MKNDKIKFAIIIIIGLIIFFLLCRYQYKKDIEAFNYCTSLGYSEQNCLNSMNGYN